jgi:hypothetical protein
MMFPLELGVTELSEDSETDIAKRLLVRLQGVGGYASGDDSLRVKELLSLAAVLSISSATIKAALANAHRKQSTELLADYEREYRLANDAARSIEERQKRLAYVHSIPEQVSQAALTSLLQRAAAGAVAIRIDAGHAGSWQSAGELATMQSAVYDPAYTEKSRRSLLAMMRRYMPAWSYGQHATDQYNPFSSFTSGAKYAFQNTLEPASAVERVVCSDDVATWGSSQLLNETAIANDSNDIDFLPRYPARISPFAPASRIERKALLRLQENIFAAATGTGNGIAKPDTTRARFFALSLAAGANAYVDTFDYSGSLVKYTIQVSSSDIRPSGAADADMGVIDPDDNSGQDAARGLYWSGAGTYDVTLDTSVAMRGTASGLRITNSTAGTRYFVGYVESVQCTGGGVEKVTAGRYGYGNTLSGFGEDWHTALRESAGAKPGNGASNQAWEAWPDDQIGGGARAGFFRIVGDAADPQTLPIDGSIDWRDRLLVVYPTSLVCDDGDGVTPSYPGAHFDRFKENRAGQIFYTGAGKDRDFFDRDYSMDVGGPFGVGDDSISIFADEDGVLCAYRSGGIDTVKACGVAIVYSDQLGLAIDGFPQGEPAGASTGDNILAEQLNHYQDVTLFAQFSGTNTESSRTWTTYEASRAVPLGPVRSGTESPPVAMVTLARPRRGVVKDPLVEIRQPIAGRIRRVAWRSATSGFTTQLDSSIDWRDRLITIRARVSTSDIRPVDGMSQSSFNAASDIDVAFYSGPGGADYKSSGTSYFEVDASNGQLVYKNTSGSTQYLGAWIEATFSTGAYTR